ncbi:hypothetical protein KTO58_01085 [Chitinophaga pendula]|uniref:hypothetical protein n=1 Tax=Chitinophaga TaxID=79328 RepID=UPI000BAEDD58|nr:MULTISPECIES: hypothetical protein [Chitinophaga]ASZ14548.1 hypothetical protein CK934_28155 [Chitinophaga sp. MD30]UCJ07799.1 hypothetical protein KTO58_01085 [Chitinophaga pendula]
MSAVKLTSKAGQFVNAEHVNTLRQNYRDSRWVQNSRIIGKSDSLSVWYSLNELRHFLDTASAAGADGIKVYFGVYPSDYKENVLLQDRQTVVFVATQQKTSESGKSENKDLYVSTKQGPEIVAYNLGSACPPFCRPTETFGLPPEVFMKDVPVEAR